MSIVTHRRELWRLIEGVKGNIAEIGVAEGYFSADMLAWNLNPSPLVYMVDRWLCNPGQKGDGGHSQAWHDKNFAAANARVSQYGGRAVFLRGDSVEMARHVPNESLALLYIDCDHSYLGVMNDLNAWVPKVVKGGIVALHDYENPSYGVKEATEDFCRGKYQIKLLPEDKPEDAGAYFQIC